MHNKNGNAYRSRREIAAFLTENGFPTAPATLAKQACVGGGPPFHKWGRRVIYEVAASLEWARRRASQTVTSTTELRAVQKANPGHPATVKR